jgi:hypothetical protein
LEIGDGGEAKVATSLNRKKRLLRGENSSWAEAVEGFHFIVEGGNDFEQTKYFQDIEDVASGRQQFEFAARAFDGNARFYNYAYARAVDLGQIYKIQQQVAFTGGGQAAQVLAEELALATIDGGAAQKINDADVAAFTG